MHQAPAETAQVQVESDDVALSLPVLFAGTEAVDVSGPVLSEQEALSAETPLIVVIDEIKLPSQISGSVSQVLSLYNRRIARLRDKGVKLVLVRCDVGSLLFDTAESFFNQPLALRTVPSSDCCIALVTHKRTVAGKSAVAHVDPMRAVKVPVRNVIGVLRGSDSELSKEAVLVSAHLDHIGRATPGRDRINNGADDNATGVPAVVSMADAFAKLTSRPQRSIVFVTFWGEEKGMKGSRHLVENPLWPLSDIVANVNIEMVGRPEKDAFEKAWMTGWKHSNMGEMMNAGAQRVDVEVFNRTDVGEMLYKQSDNISFVQKGVIAHSFSAGSLHSDYHQPTDEWEKLEIPHMTKVIQGLFAGTLHIAENADQLKKR